MPLSDSVLTLGPDFTHPPTCPPTHPPTPQNAPTPSAQVWANCREYNEEGSDIMAECNSTQQAFEAAWRLEGLPLEAAAWQPQRAAELRQQAAARLTALQQEERARAAAAAAAAAAMVMPNIVVAPRPAAPKPAAPKPAAPKPAQKRKQPEGFQAGVGGMPAAMPGGAPVVVTVAPAGGMPVGGMQAGGGGVERAAPASKRSRAKAGASEGDWQQRAMQALQRLMQLEASEAFHEPVSSPAGLGSGRAGSVLLYAGRVTRVSAVQQHPHPPPQPLRPRPALPSAPPSSNPTTPSACALPALPSLRQVPRDVPGYHDIIKKPRCLEQIQRNLQRSKYANPAELLADVQLVWDNCREARTEPARARHPPRRVPMLRKKNAFSCWGLLRSEATLHAGALCSRDREGGDGQAAEQVAFCLGCHLCLAAGILPCCAPPAHPIAPPLPAVQRARCPSSG